MLRLREPRIIHNFREGNKVAHKLAREALKEGSEFQLLNNPPSYVINNLASDRASCVYFVKTMAVTVCAQLAEWGNLNVLETCYYVGDVIDANR